jgi:hypothetical protein
VGATSGLALLAVAAGCFAPEYRDCRVTCDDAVACPSPLVCQSGYCNHPGSTVICGAPDAGDAPAAMGDGGADADAPAAIADGGADASAVDAAGDASSSGPAPGCADGATAAAPAPPWLCRDAGCSFAIGPPGWDNQRAQLPTVRSHLALIAGTDGTMFALGGLDEGDQPNVDVYAYSPDTDSWTASGDVASLPAPRSGLAGAVGADGRLYAIGGNDGLNDLASVLVLDPAAGGGSRWAAVKPMSAPRSGLAAVVGPDGRIYAVGGRNGGPLHTLEAYSPGADTWATLAPMPTARADLGLAVGGDGLLYAVGGTTDAPVSGGGADSLDVVEIYDPVCDSWRTGPPLGLGRDGPAVLGGPDGRIYVIGGTHDVFPADNSETLFPPAGAWERFPLDSSNLDRRGVAVAADGRLFLVGGEIAGAPIALVNIYGPHVWLASSGSVRAGDTMRIAGQNLAANAQVRVFVRPASATAGATYQLIDVPAATTTGDGGLTGYSVPMPSVPPGDYILYVVDDQSNYPGRVRVTVIQ